MLSLSQKLSLNTTATWSPYKETSLIAWFKHNTAVTHSGNEVSSWADSSANSYDMVQTPDAAKKPDLLADGSIHFDGGDSLQSTSQLTLTGAFVIGIVFKPASTLSNDVILGDNTSGSHFFRLNDNNTIGIKSGGIQTTFDLNGGNSFDAGSKYYILITRDTSNNIEIFYNGTKQTDTSAKSGSVLIDALCVRATDLNEFDGDIFEVQIYNSESLLLTDNVNKYLSKL